MAVIHVQEAVNTGRKQRYMSLNISANHSTLKMLPCQKWKGMRKSRLYSNRGVAEKNITNKDGKGTSQTNGRQNYRREISKGTVHWPDSRREMENVGCTPKRSPIRLLLTSPQRSRSIRTFWSTGSDSRYYEGKRDGAKRGRRKQRRHLSRHNH